MNPIYHGKIVHKGTVYHGEHKAIVDEELWNEVQERLQAPRRRPRNDPQPSLLRGLLTVVREDRWSRLMPSKDHGATPITKLARIWRDKIMLQRSGSDRASLSGPDSPDDRSA